MKRLLELTATGLLGLFQIFTLTAMVVVIAVVALLAAAINGVLRLPRRLLGRGKEVPLT